MNMINIELRRFFLTISKVSITFKLVWICKHLYPHNIDVTSKQYYASQVGAICAIMIVSTYNMRYRMQINEYDWLPFVYHIKLLLSIVYIFDPV